MQIFVIYYAELRACTECYFCPVNIDVINNYIGISGHKRKYLLCNTD